MSGATVGSQLRQAREERGLSLEQVAQATRIRIHYLVALEAGDLERIPSLAQGRGFLRVYAGFLGLPAETLLRDLNGSPPLPVAAPLSADLPGSPPAPVPAPPPAANSPTPVETAVEPWTGSPPEGLSRGEPQALSSPSRPQATQNADQIFREIGTALSYQRDLLGLSLEDVERQTHLRRHYLVALEEGRIESLPSPVQGRGMLSNYAAFLSLDVEALLLRFAEGLQSRLGVKQAEQVESRPKTRPRPGQFRIGIPAPLRRFLSGDLLIGGTLAIFLVVFMLWGAIRIFTIRSAEPASPTAPSIADVLLDSPVPTQTLTPGAPTLPAGAIPLEQATPTLSSQETLTVPLTTGDGTGVQVYINVQQRAWMRVLADGKVVFEGRVLPGSAYTYQGDRDIEVVTGNGAALRIFYNNQDLGALGAFGQIVDRIFTASGIVTPTPTITPTSSPTPKVTATPTGGAGEAGTPTRPALP